MEPGKRYKVTKASDDGTFEVGDHVWLNDDGSINCLEANGWIDACDVPFATKGMVVGIDQEWVALRIRMLQANLEALMGDITGGADA